MAKAKTIGRRSREIVFKENAESRQLKNSQRFLDAQGAVTFLGISIATLRVWSSSRNGQKPRIPVIKVGRNLARYDRESLTTWMKLQEHFGTLPEWTAENRESLTKWSKLKESLPEEMRR